LQGRFASFSANNLGREMQQKTREFAEKLKLTKCKTDNTASASLEGTQEALLKKSNSSNKGSTG
jgi:hypothetical protein